jgi:hypothetical protein
VTIKEEKAKDKHEKCTKKRNDLWHVFSWRRNVEVLARWIDIWLKTPKNHVKICIIKGSF